MELKIAMQPTVFELQVIDLGLELVVQHIEDGESISIVGGDPAQCMYTAKELRIKIGMAERREPGEYPIQRSFLPSADGRE